MIPKPKSLVKLSSIILIFITLLFYYACKKDSKTSTQTLLNNTVLQAKQWYESLYPVNVNAQKNITTQTIKQSNGAWLDFSQFILPDWAHAITYTRLGDQVIEMPIDSSSFYGFDFKNATANRVYSNKKYNRSFFVLLNSGKGYEAYIMMIMADSGYVNNDLTKLSHNSYRTHDADFTGMVLYFTPKGQYVSGYGYKQGQLLIPNTSNSATTTTDNNKLKIDVAQPKPVEVCTDWYLNTYVGSELISSQYVGTTCEEVDNGGTGSGGGSGGGSDAPPYCTSSSGSSGGAQSVRSPVTNVEGPPPGGGGSGGTGTNPTNPTNPVPPTDGGFPPPDDSNEQCTVSVQDTLLKSGNLTKSQMDSLQAVLNNVDKNCLGQALNNYFTGNNDSFSVILSPSSTAPAAYNPSTNNIIVKSLSGLTSDALQEELFHAYQNKTMPGGTTQYAGKSGSANIEFESKVMRDIQTYMNIINGSQSGSAEFAIIDPNYTDWLKDITNNFTQYPASFTASELTQYFNFIPEFLQQNTGYSNDITNPNLAPSALFTLILSSNCSN